MKQDLQNPKPDLANQVVREDFGIARSVTAVSPKLKPASVTRKIAVTLLTGGIDRPYTFGLVMELVSKGAVLDVIGSDGVDFPEFHSTPGINFLNLQGSQRADVSLARKVFRLAAYYAKVMHYAAIAKPKIFHILWNNKFQLFDRTLLTLFYRLLGKKIVLTVHNVNAAKRDSKDTLLNRLTLRIQYRLAHHIFVHTQKMSVELSEEFGVRGARVTVIPFGINNAVPITSLSRSEARQRLGISADKKTILFFGRITPYKGLEYLISAFQRIIHHDEFQLIVVGRPENDCQSYWSAIKDRTLEDVRLGRILLRAEHIPDDETEIYFKAADVLALPYRRIYQSGVLFLGYSFGLPILAADVGDLKDEIVEGETGFVFKPEDPVVLAKTIERYFSSDLFLDLNNRRQKISNYAKERHSWNVVGQTTMIQYAGLLRPPFPTGMPKREVSETSVDTKMPY
jgi:glycosyltransferase involved in cell wall biosynthesis